MRRRTFWALAFVFCLVFAVWAMGASLVGSRLTVTIKNADSVRLSSVVVHVTGRSYLIGDLEPGASVTTGTKPTSESHVEVEFLDSNGDSKRLIADCYFERGYQGNVSVELNEEKVLQVRDTITSDAY